MKINLPEPETVKLYEVPNGRRVRMAVDARVAPYSIPLPKDTIVQFFRVDGMYSFCRLDKGGEVVHPSASTLVEVL